MAENFNFVTVGPVNYDTNVYPGVDHIRYLRNVMIIPDAVIDHPGGVVVNIASGLNSITGNVAVCGVTGNDVLGNLVITQISDLGIDVTNVRRDLKKTPRSIIMVTRDGERTIINDSAGLPDYIYPTEQFRTVVERTSWMYFSPARFAQDLIAIAKHNGVRIATDLQAPNEPLSYYKTYMQNTDILFINGKGLRMACNSFIDIAWQCGSQIVIVTYGPQGVVVGLKNSHSIKSYRAVPTDNVIDTTGAGDCLASAFCGCTSLGMPVEESIKRALIFASRKIGVRGSIFGMMSKTELDDCYQNMVH